MSPSKITQSISNENIPPLTEATTIPTMPSNVVTKDMIDVMIYHFGKRHKELVNPRTETTRISYDTKMLKETTINNSLKILEQEKKLYYLTKSFEESLLEDECQK